MKDYTEPTWGFTHNDGEGNITTKSFSTSSSTWVEALSRFLDFIRGVGYTVANDAVAINADIEVGEESWSGNYYINENTLEDWKHPDDFYPPFEGELKGLTTEEFIQSLAQFSIKLKGE